MSARTSTRERRKSKRDIKKKKNQILTTSIWTRALAALERHVVCYEWSAHIVFQLKHLIMCRHKEDDVTSSHHVATGGELSSRMGLWCHIAAFKHLFNVLKYNLHSGSAIRSISTFLHARHTTGRCLYSVHAWFMKKLREKKGPFPTVS